MLTIDFENVYNCRKSSSDLRRTIFHARITKGNFVELCIEIDGVANPEFRGCNVLAFGPLKSDGSIDTTIAIDYLDVAKVISTVLLQAWAFLNLNRHSCLILNGSTELTIVLYHQMLKSNRAYLEKYFRPIGIDYYVRLKRNDTYEKDKYGKLLPKPMILDFDYDRTKQYLYRYYALQINMKSIVY